jgi:hypothetical protein
MRLNFWNGVYAEFLAIKTVASWDGSQAPRRRRTLPKWLISAAELVRSQSGREG